MMGTTGKLTLGCAGAIVAILLAFAGQAAAATTTIGQLAPDPYTTEVTEGGGYGGGGGTIIVYKYTPPAATCTIAQDYLQESASTGTAYVVPANGEKITAWRTNATTGAGQEMTFKVFRKVGAEYEVVGKDITRTLSPALSPTGKGKVNEFAGLSIPVQPGDLIGIYPNNAGAANSACLFSQPGTYLFSGTNIAQGSKGPFTSATGSRLNLVAVVLLAKGSGPVQQTLTVNTSGIGTGFVQSAPAGIEACSSSCSHAYDEGTKVTLTATPDGYSSFGGWSGGGCSGTGPCEVTLGAETTVTATFNAGGSGYRNGGENSSEGTGGGEKTGSNSKAVKCKKSKRHSHKGKKPHCVKKTKVVVKRAHNASLGKEILTTKTGRTLYSLSAEGGVSFICTGSCLSVWHPLTIPAGVVPLGPVKLGTVIRPEGSTQVTYHGKPLYTFTEDAAPGDVHGEGIKDVGTWAAVVVPPPKH